MIVERKRLNPGKVLNVVVFFGQTALLNAAVGGVFGILGAFIDLLILYPLLMGLACGHFIEESIKTTRVRSITLTAVAAVLSAILCYASSHVARYYSELAIATYQVLGDFSDANLEIVTKSLDIVLAEQTGQTGIIGFVLLRAKEGVSIGRIAGSTRLHLGTALTWSLWGLELLAIAVVAFLAGKGLAEKPYCEHCQDWFPIKRHIGGLSLEKEAQLLGLLSRKDFYELGRCLEEDAESPSLELYLQHCASCDRSEAYLSLAKAHPSKGKLALVDVSRMTITPRQCAALLEARFPEPAD